MGESTDEGNVHIQVSLADGSKGEILYLASGDASVSKERWRSSAEAVRRFARTSASPSSINRTDADAKSLFQQDKGHAEEMRRFVDAVAGKAPDPHTFREPLGNHPGDVSDSRVIAPRRGARSGDHRGR